MIRRLSINGLRRFRIVSTICTCSELLQGHVTLNTSGDSLNFITSSPHTSSFISCYSMQAIECIFTSVRVESFVQLRTSLEPMLYKTRYIRDSGPWSFSTLWYVVRCGDYRLTDVDADVTPLLLVCKFSILVFKPCTYVIIWVDGRDLCMQLEK
jgi:hypothetical protein